MNETTSFPTTELPTYLTSSSSTILPSVEPSNVMSSSNITATATDADSTFEWTTTAIVQCIFLFVAAGVAEIVGGWLVWMAVRGNEKYGGKKSWWWAILGSLVLILYGFIPTFQPTDSFGRSYAVYGVFFIVLAFVFGWALDGEKPDIGDGVGASIALVGVCIIMFWPR